jgi:sigma-E factor negative regulatory protein RseA
MKEQQQQALSSLLDGELTAAQASGVLDALERDPELRGMWERYHLIGGALRGEAVVMAYRDLAERTRVQIATEPTILAPAGTRPRGPSRLAPFAGVALAASAAFLAVFAVPSLFEPAATPPGAPTAAPTQASAPAPESRAAASERFLVGRPVQRWHLDQPAVASKLDRLLVNHQEYAPATGINGMLPYATLVSYDAGR